MIQIIGFLIYACLAVKLLEMSGNPALQNESGGPRGPILAGLLLGWASVFGFAFWLLMQGDAFPKTATIEPYTPALTQQQIECIEKNAGNPEAVLACVP